MYGKRYFLLIKGKNIETIQLQPIADISAQSVPTQSHDPYWPECNKMRGNLLENNCSQFEVGDSSSSSLYADSAEPDGGADHQILHAYLELHDETLSASHINEYDSIEEYERVPIIIGHEPLTTDEEYSDTRTHSPRNRPLPAVIPISNYEPLNTNAGNTNGNKVVSYPTRIWINKIVFMFTVLIIVLVASGVVTTMVLLTKNDEQTSKSFVDIIYIYI